MGPEKDLTPISRSLACETARSENKLQSQLHRTASTGTDYRISSGDVRCSARASERLNRRIVKAETILSAVRVGEIRVIENVEEFGPELRVETLGEMPVLRHREVHVAESRVREDVAAHVAKAPEGGRNHDGIAFRVASEQIKCRAGRTGCIAAIQRQCLRVASRVCGWS